MGKRSRYRADSPPHRAFAPALAPKKKKAQPQDEEEPTFRWTTASSAWSQPTWNTFDPDTSTRTWGSVSDSNNRDNNESAVIWDQWATAPPRVDVSTGGDGLDVAPEVRRQFVEERFLMREGNQPRSTFERNNASLFGLNFASSIVSQIGDQQVVFQQKIDNRAEFRDENNNYIDGKDRGKMAKRFEDELAKRRVERREEMKRADTLYKEWQMLGEAEKDARRRKAKENRAKVLESLKTELEEAIPAAYQMDNNALWERVRAYKASRVQASSEPYSGRPPVAGFIQDDNSSEALFIPLDDDPEPSVVGSENVGTSLYQSSRLPQTPQVRGRANHRQRGYKSLPNAPRAYYDSNRNRPAFSQPPSTPQHTTTYRPSRNGTSQAGRSRIGASVPGSNSRTPSTSCVPASVFENWPELTPMEDVRKVPEREYINEIVEYSELELMCSQRGRLVVVSVVPGVAYTSAAIIDRTFGGAIQEIQFYPEDRQALLAFLSPLDASGFLEHIAACQRTSAHEYRRLQIHASFYKGNVDTAVYPSQEGVLTSAIVNKASRALLIDNVHKQMKQEALLLAFKNRFTDKHLVRLRLVAPKKNYEKDNILCNKVILEFSSIKQAIEVKQFFDDHQVFQFEQSNATFLTDPAATPKERKPWCTCFNCRPKAAVESDEMQNGGDGDLATSNSTQLAESFVSFAAPRSESSGRTFGADFLRGTKDLRASGESWDVKGEMKLPGAFTQRSNQPLQPEKKGLGSHGDARD
jgi:hypothetical protein